MIKFFKSIVCAVLWHDLKGEERGICRRCGKIVIPIR